MRQSMVLVWTRLALDNIRTQIKLYVAGKGLGKGKACRFRNCQQIPEEVTLGQVKNPNCSRLLEIVRALSRPWRTARMPFISGFNDTTPGPARRISTVPSFAKSWLCSTNAGFAAMSP